MKPLRKNLPTLFPRRNPSAPVRGLALLVALALIGGCGGDDNTGPSGAVTRIVNAGGGGDFTDIQICILNSAGGDTCLVYPGTYGPVNFVGRAVTVQSLSGPAVTFIDGQDAYTAVHFINYETEGSVLNGFTIRNGRARTAAAGQASAAEPLAVLAGEQNGGGVRILAASPTIYNCVIKENHAEGNGGGIFCAFAGARPQLTHVVFQENTAENGQGGGLYVFSGSPQLHNCLFLDNQAQNGGAASVTFGGGLFLSNCTLCNHALAATRTGVASAQTRTDGIYLYNASAAIENSICWTRIGDLGPVALAAPILMDFDPALPQDYQTTLSLVTTLTNVDLTLGRIANRDDIMTETCAAAPDRCYLQTEEPICFDPEPETYYPGFVPLALEDPEEVPDPANDFFLEQITAGQEEDSPALDAARKPNEAPPPAPACQAATTAVLAGLDDRTTQNGATQPPKQNPDGSTGAPDPVKDAILDLGFHYPVSYP